MALTINEDTCARCGVCESECPNGAIYQTESEYVINPLLCTECKETYGEPLCEAACPNESIEKVQDSLYKKCLSLFS
jgi:ferredoxin